MGRNLDQIYRHMHIIHFIALNPKFITFMIEHENHMNLNRIDMINT